jgi:hypothetical protein
VWLKVCIFWWTYILVCLVSWLLVTTLGHSNLLNDIVSSLKLALRAVNNSIPADIL